MATQDLEISVVIREQNPDKTARYLVDVTIDMERIGTVTVSDFVHPTDDRTLSERERQFYLKRMADAALELILAGRPDLIKANFQRDAPDLGAKPRETVIR